MTGTYNEKKATIGASSPWALVEVWLFAVAFRGLRDQRERVSGTFKLFVVTAVLYQQLIFR